MWNTHTELYTHIYTHLHTHTHPVAYTHSCTHTHRGTQDILQLTIRKECEFQVYPAAIKLFPYLSPARSEGPKARPGSPHRFLCTLTLTYKRLTDSAQFSSKSIRTTTKINVHSHIRTPKDAQGGDIWDSHAVHGPASGGSPLLASCQWQGSSYTLTMSFSLPF